MLVPPGSSDKLSSYDGACWGFESEVRYIATPHYGQRFVLLLAAGGAAPCENVIALIKRFKIIADRYRNHRRRFGLRFFLIAAIHNAELNAA